MSYGKTTKSQIIKEIKRNTIPRKSEGYCRGDYRLRMILTINSKGELWLRKSWVNKDKLDKLDENIPKLKTIICSRRFSSILEHLESTNGAIYKKDLIEYIYNDMKAHSYV